MLKRMSIIIVSTLLTFIAFLQIVNFKNNKIYDQAFDESQSDLLEMLNIPESTASLYKIKSDGKFEKLELWVEVYENGILVEPRAVEQSFYSDFNFCGTSFILLQTSKAQNYTWLLTYKNGNTIASSVSLPTNYYNQNSSQTTKFDSVKNIKINEEILLEAKLFASDNNKNFIVSHEELESNKELYENYEYVHLLKCKFSLD